MLCENVWVCVKEMLNVLLKESFIVFESQCAMLLTTQVCTTYLETTKCPCVLAKFKPLIWLYKKSKLKLELNSHVTTVGGILSATERREDKPWWRYTRTSNKKNVFYIHSKQKIAGWSSDRHPLNSHEYKKGEEVQHN